MKIILILLLFYSNFLFSQVKTDSHKNDTLIYAGVINQNTYIGNNLDNLCLPTSDNFIQNNSLVFICSEINCFRSFTGDSVKLYEIAYRGTLYYIQQDKIITADTDKIQKIKYLKEDLKDSIKNEAVKASILVFKNELNKAVEFFNKCNLKGLMILEWEHIDESSYTKGTGISIKVSNPTQKPIKYIWFTYVGYNPVGDVVVDSKRGKNITMQAVGPIEPRESATYRFEYVWFSDLIESVKITSIKVQYMDGSIKIITNPKEIIITQDLYELITEIK